MKKVVLIMLCVLIATTGVFAQGRSEMAGAEKKIVLGYAALDDSQEHLIPVRENIKKVAAELGVDVIAVDNAGDGQRAINNVDNLLLQGIDCLIEFNLDSAVNPVIKEKCDAAGVPIIAIDIPVPGAPCFGANNVESGLIVGRSLGQLAKDNWGGKVDLILLLSTPAGGEIISIRMGGIVKGIIEKNPSAKNVKVITVDYKDDPILAQQLTADVLTSNPDKKNILIGSINDIGAQGAFAAIQAARRDKDCFVVNHGMSVQTRENLYETIRTGKDNAWRGGVAYFLERYGEYVVPAAIKLAKGETVPDNIYMDHIFINKHNIEEHYPQAQWGQK
ncbi:MAG: sugar ABC transporter substrate-binding protein [Sphaerochaetaceae bacterium]|jgi:ribose transport system substrate-binding protein